MWWEFKKRRGGKDGLNLRPLISRILTLITTPMAPLFMQLVHDTLPKSIQNWLGRNYVAILTSNKLTKFQKKKSYFFSPKKGTT